MMKQIFIAGFTVFTLASCHNSNSPVSSAVARTFIDRANMDTAVRPGDNFFAYANGAWLKKNPIPKALTSWGSFDELQENNFKVLHLLLDSAAAANAPQGSITQKVGDFYSSGMDSSTINKVGMPRLMK